MCWRCWSGRRSFAPRSTATDIFVGQNEGNGGHRTIFGHEQQLHRKRLLATEHFCRPAKMSL